MKIINETRSIKEKRSKRLIFSLELNMKKKNSQSIEQKAKKVTSST